jgi:hypothetical protein
MSAKWKSNATPTGAVLLATFFKEQMEKTETILIRGRRTKVCLLEITVRRLVQQALHNDDRAVKDLLYLVNKAEKWRKLQPRRQVLVLNPADANL